MKLPTMERVYERIDQARRDATKIIETLNNGDTPSGYRELAWIEACSALHHRWQDASKGEGVLASHRALQIALIGITERIDAGKPESPNRPASSPRTPYSAPSRTPRAPSPHSSDADAP